MLAGVAVMTPRVARFRRNPASGRSIRLCNRAQGAKRGNATHHELSRHERGSVRTYSKKLNF